MTNVIWKGIKKDLKALDFIDGQKVCECICNMLHSCNNSTLPLGFGLHLFFPTVCMLSKQEFYLHLHNHKIGTQIGYECILSQLFVGEAQMHLTEICGVKLNVQTVELVWQTYCYDCILGKEFFPTDIYEMLLSEETSCDVIAYFGSVYISSTYSDFISKIKINKDESKNTQMFECPVCLEQKPNGVHVFYCAHMFCKDCAISLYEKNKVNCPMCRAAMKEEKIEKDTVKTQIISELIEIMFLYATKLIAQHLLRLGSLPDKLSQKDFINACTYVQEQQLPQLSNKIGKMISEIQTNYRS